MFTAEFLYYACPFCWFYFCVDYFMFIGFIGSGHNNSFLHAWLHSQPGVQEVFLRKTLNDSDGQAILSPLPVSAVASLSTENLKNNRWCQWLFAQTKNDWRSQPFQHSAKLFGWIHPRWIHCILEYWLDSQSRFITNIRPIGCRAETFRLEGTAAVKNNPIPAPKIRAAWLYLKCPEDSCLVYVCLVAF